MAAILFAGDGDVVGPLVGAGFLKVQGQNVSGAEAVVDLDGVGSLRGGIGGCRGFQVEIERELG